VRIPSRPLRTFTGPFQDIRLYFTPEPPLTEQERSHYSQNYPTTLAYLHVYLGEEDATEFLPSGYLLWILDGLLHGVADLVTGRSATATSDWGSDPWQFDLRGDPAHNRVYITLHVPGRWVAMRDVFAPLDRFGEEVIRLAQKWEKYLHSLYHEEMIDPEWGKDYRLFQQHLKRAQHALRSYKGR